MCFINSPSWAGKPLQSSHVSKKAQTSIELTLFDECGKARYHSRRILRYHAKVGEIQIDLEGPCLAYQRADRCCHVCMRSYECRWSTAAACPCVEQKLRVTPPREVVAFQAMFLLYVTAAAEGSFIYPHMIWRRWGQHLYYAGNWQ